jgi:hypothetical protein
MEIGQSIMKEPLLFVLLRSDSRFGRSAFCSGERKGLVMPVREQTRRLTSRQREGRAINAVAELLRRRLSVPNIYIEPPSSVIAADILAVDRGGAGDLHAVVVKLDEGDGFAEGSRGVTSSAKGLFAAAHRKKIWHEKLRATHRQLMAMPAHFRYLVVPEEGFNNLSAALNDIGLFSEDGIGRLGIITIKQNGNSTPQPAIAVVPERFRVDDAKVRRIEMKLLTISPDIAVRV